MITTVIFDIGNVLVAFDWEGTLKSFHFLEEEYEAIANAVYRSENWNEMDRGVLTLEELLGRFCQAAPEYEEDIRRVILTGTCRTIHQYLYTKPMIRALKEMGLRVYYLSNYGEFAYKETKQELDFTELMDGGIYSYEVKMIKPNRWFYEELLTRYHIDPHEAIFFDDNPKNVETAKTLGMVGVRFTGYEDAMLQIKIALNSILNKQNLNL